MTTSSNKSCGVALPIERNYATSGTGTATTGATTLQPTGLKALASKVLQRNQERNLSATSEKSGRNFCAENVVVSCGGVALPMCATSPESNAWYPVGGIPQLNNFLTDTATCNLHVSCGGKTAETQAGQGSTYKSCAVALYRERNTATSEMGRAKRIKSLPSPIALAWLLEHRQALDAAGWTRPELYRRNPSKLGLAWLKLWDEAFSLAYLHEDGCIEFECSVHGRDFFQTARPHRAKIKGSNAK